MNRAWTTQRLETLEQVEPVTPEEAAYRCRLDCVPEDIAGYITAARIYAENMMRGSIVVQRYRALYRQPNHTVSNFFKLPFPPAISVDKVIVEGGVELDTSEYRFFRDSHISSVVEVFGRRTGEEICIDFMAGYQSPADVPQDIKTAIYMLIAHMYEQYIATSDTQITEVPLGVDSILRRYREITYY